MNIFEKCMYCQKAEAHGDDAVLTCKAPVDNRFKDQCEYFDDEREKKFRGCINEK